MRFFFLLRSLILVGFLPVTGAVSTYQLFLSQEAVVEAAAKRVVGGVSTATEGKAQLRVIRTQQTGLKGQLKAAGIEVIGATAVLQNSVLVLADDAQVASLRSMTGVIGIEKVTPLFRQTRTSVPFIGAPRVWESSIPGLTGRGVRIGIIDSGIDYTHATFGGSGKVDDYLSNAGTVIESGTFPTEKVAGGTDFAGDNYDASGENGSPSPLPDPDPLDPQASGHGTHVAAIAAGYGVLDSGETFAGPYGVDSYRNIFRVGPGVAPEAILYAFKIFGRMGATSLVALGLDAAADPNGDGDTSDRMDVVNLSLGTHFATEAESGQYSGINRLVALGCVVVVAAGNAGNTSYALGAPGSFPKTVTVANTYDDGAISSTFSITAPVRLAGEYAMVEGVFTRPIAQGGILSAQLVQALPYSGCQDGNNGLITNRTALKGKIALMNRGTCFFVQKIREAQAAGAVAVVMVNNVDGFPIPMGGSGDTSDIKIPGVMISKANGNLIVRHLTAGVIVRLEPKAASVRPELADQIADSTSRGPVAFSSRLKPDIAAPGSAIPSARAGFGTESVRYTGTSMSAPHVSGAVALLRQRHPDWSAQEIKAVLMNTAARTANADGIAYPESRTGSGRISVADAAGSTFLAFNDDAPDEVSLSLGFLEISQPFTVEKRIRVVNKGLQPIQLSIAVSNTFGARTATLIPQMTELTVAAGQSRSVPFTFRANPLWVEDDPTTPDVQGERLRPKMPEVSGQIWFRTSHQAVHVPWYSLIRPVSLTRTGVTNLGLPNVATSSLVIPVSRPSLESAGLVGVFQLGRLSSDRGMGFPAGAADVLAFGAATDHKTDGDILKARVFFGLATAARWVTPQPVFHSLGFEIDSNLDGAVDYRVLNSTGGNVNANSLADSSFATDFLLSVVQPVSGGALVEGDVLNVLDPKVYATSVFHNGVIVHSVPASALGVRSWNSRIRYRAVVSGAGASETTPWVDFDVAAPTVDGTRSGIERTPWQLGQRDIRMRVVRGGATVSALVLYLNNPIGKQVDVVRFDPSTPDIDRNGLIDVEELIYFPKLGNASAGDPDGDGLTTAFELGHGSDPLDRLSGFRLGPISALIGEGGGRAISWPTVPGRTYGVQRALLGGGPFESLVTGLVAETRTQVFTDPHPPSEGALYRIVAE